MKIRRGKRVEASRVENRGTRGRQRGLVVVVEKDAIIFTSYSSLFRRLVERFSSFDNSGKRRRQDANPNRRRTC